MSNKYLLDLYKQNSRNGNKGSVFSITGTPSKYTDIIKGSLDLSLLGVNRYVSEKSSNPPVAPAPETYYLLADSLGTILTTENGLNLVTA